jgi:DNA-binding NarL/FixJ family response regulator
MIRLVLADDSVLMRQGIARMLTDQEFEIVGQATDAQSALEVVTDTLPDVAVLDVRMPPDHTDDGLRVAEQVISRHPQVGVLMLSQYVETMATLRLLQRRTRGVGYLLKDRVTEIETLASAIRRVAEGGSVVDEQVAAALMERRRLHDPLEELTPRERQVLALMAEGRSNSAISGILYLSERTVESHVGQIFRKLGLADTPDDHRRVLAVIAFLGG